MISVARIKQHSISGHVQMIRRKRRTIFSRGSQKAALAEEYVMKQDSSPTNRQKLATQKI
jgi:hypothetical protein